MKHNNHLKPRNRLLCILFLSSSPLLFVACDDSSLSRCERITEKAKGGAHLEYLVDEASGRFPESTVKDNNLSLNYIDTSAVTAMISLFRNDSEFNGAIDCWDTSNVTDMHNMFENAKAFNQDLSNWDVRNVKDHTDVFLNSGMDSSHYSPMEAMNP